MKTILVLHKGGLGGIRGTEICMIHAVQAYHARGFRVVVVRDQPVVDQELLPYVVALLDLSFPEVMANGFKISLPLLDYCRSLRKLVSIIKEYDVSVINTSGGLPCQLAVPAAKLTATKVLCHFHHPANKRHYYLWLLKYVDHCIFPSQYTRSHTLAKANVDGEVVYNGVDPERFKPPEIRDTTFRRSLGISDDAVVVGQVGHLTEHKRPLFLLKAFRVASQNIPALHLCIVGTGPQEQKLRDEVVSLGLQARVTVTGRVASLVPYLQQVFDINVMTSREEGLGISIIEGAACGLPAIVTDCTGLRETIEEGISGYSFPVNDQALLVNLIEKLAQNEILRKKNGEAARELVIRKFSLEQYKQGVVEAAEKLLL